MLGGFCGVLTVMYCALSCQFCAVLCKYRTMYGPGYGILIMCGFGSSERVK